MSQGQKAALYRELKEAGTAFDQPYRNYNTEQLLGMVRELRSQPGYQAPANPPPPLQPQETYRPPEQPADTMAGLRAYHDGEKPHRVDEQGFAWYRDEVRKPSIPSPRARRKLSYIDPGVRKETVVSGMYTETVEVAGDEQRTGEIRITMPSYQVGIYRDPRMPFKIHVYNENRGFDLFDVEAFYGGADLVPAEVKRVYIEDTLCYDIRTTIRAIQTEHRQNQLMRGLA